MDVETTSFQSKDFTVGASEKWDSNNSCNNTFAINESLEKKLHEIAKKEGYVDYKIQSRKLGFDGSNLLGILTEVTIIGTTVSGCQENNIFVKLFTPGMEIFKLLEVNDLYEKEIFVYAELSKILTEIQEEAKIPHENKYNFVKYYEESDMKCIIMENMAKKGYGTCNKDDIVSFEFAKKSFEQLAKFHALSFVLQEQKPKYFDENIKTFKPPYVINEDWEIFISNMYNKCVQYLDDSTQEKFKKHFPGPSSVAKKISDNITKPNSIRCLCHGDYRPNNILRKVTNGTLELIPIDYQLLNYGSPNLDIFYFLVSGTDGAFRRKHLDYLRNLYYDSMKQFMYNYFEIHVENFYPRNVYEQDYKDQLGFAIATGVWALPMLLADEDNLPDLAGIKASELNFGTNDKAKARFQELVEDFLQ